LKSTSATRQKEATLATRRPRQSSCLPSG